MAKSNEKPTVLPRGVLQQIADCLITPFNKARFKCHASRYRKKVDQGGIAYLASAVCSGQVVFDIGAHKGGHLYYIRSRVGNAGKVFAFEPQLKLSQQLRRLVRAFRWHNVRVEHLAFSHQPGEVVMYIPKENTSRTSLGATLTPQGSLQGFFTESITATTLDSYCREAGLWPDFLKIDVEGAELNVLRGASCLLNNIRPKILMECEAWRVGQEQVKHTFEYLYSFGYVGYFIQGVEKRPLEEFDFSQHQNPNAGVYSNNFIFECTQP